MAPVLAAASWVDVRERRIPNGLNLFGAGLALSLIALGLGKSSTSGLLWAVALGVPLCLLSLAVPKGWGMGDSKLTAVIALFIGPQVVVAFVLACLAGLLAAWAGRRFGLEAIPFAPFLAAGALAAVAIC
jgi:leader peptidase (prepilin peptidase)/N-methyltransferase